MVLEREIQNLNCRLEFAGSIGSAGFLELLILKGEK